MTFSPTGSGPSADRPVETTGRQTARSVGWPLTVRVNGVSRAAASERRWRLTSLADCPLSAPSALRSSAEVWVLGVSSP